jgi:hypothetical protein
MDNEQTQEQKNESFREYLRNAGYLDALQRFNEAYPPPKKVSTLVEALTATREASVNDIDIATTAAWYGMRFIHKMSCKAEYYHESHLHGAM